MDGAFRAVVGPEAGNTLKLLPGGTSVGTLSPIVVNDETDDAIEITNGQSPWRIGKSGSKSRGIHFAGGIRWSRAAAGWWGRLRIDRIGMRITCFG